MLCNVEITNKFSSLTTMITRFTWINSRFIAENTKSLYIALEEIRYSINKAWVWVTDGLSNKLKKNRKASII